MFLLIDNYDSFVHNLARYFELAGVKTKVVRNDEITISEIRNLAPEALILSPGPCTPKEAGICVEAIKQLGAEMPMLGVCLGHQCIGEAYGHSVTRAFVPMHGKASLIRHESEGIFKGLPSPFFVGRYHSLIVQPDENSPLTITAKNDQNEIMAMTHKDYPVYGVQFHPESVITEHGLPMIKNFVALVNDWHQRTAGMAA
jgi:para-aminobenzoate synthetase component 2